MKIAGLFAVDIDWNTKRFVKAKLDNEILNAKEAVTFLWYNTIAAQHVQRKDNLKICSVYVGIPI